jgi:acetylornithine deacetylase/succinyl-diaminopimelate desuccinylase-like protein
MVQDTIDWNEVEEQATRYLCDYLQINTINPPGNETEGARFLQGLLEKEGIETEIIESEPGRGNLIARIKGSGEGRPLVLLSHIDVVPAESDKWDHAPLSGTIVDGDIWGRGALDCKSLGVMETMVLILLKRTGRMLRRDLVLMAVADEEKGGTKGAGWLADHRPDFFDVDAVINEGGGVGITRGDNNYYFCQVAEKGICWLRIFFNGSPGHASIPREDNCLLSLGRCLDLIGKYRSRIQLPPVTGKFIETFSGDKEITGLLRKMVDAPDRADEVLEKVPDKGLRQFLGTMIRNTFVPTVVKGGEKTNVIPSECFCEVDCRIVPGEEPEQARAELSRLLRDIPDHEVEIIDSSIPSESPFEHPLFSLFAEGLQQHDPKAVLVPFVSSGATDSRFFRNKSVPAFGFDPHLVEGDLSEYSDQVHGHNERISRKNLVFGTKVLYEVVREYCGG